MIPSQHCGMEVKLLPAILPCQMALVAVLAALLTAQLPAQRAWILLASTLERIFAPMLFGDIGL